MTDELVINAQHLERGYAEGAARITVLRDACLQVRRAEMVAIVGASGSGKSTLLHILGLLDQPDAGELQIAGRAAHGLKEHERSKIRNHHLGFVYQFHHLLPEFSALDNVAMPLIVRRCGKSAARAQAQQMLEKVGLADRGSHFPGMLSGGERQRVALARALVTQPQCVLADEPTGNLDRASAQRVLQLLLQINQDFGTAFVIVTHDEDLAAKMHRIMDMHAGVLSPRA